MCITLACELSPSFASRTFPLRLHLSNFSFIFMLYYCVDENAKAERVGKSFKCKTVSTFFLNFSFFPQCVVFRLGINTCLRLHRSYDESSGTPSQTIIIDKNRVSESEFLYDFSLWENTFFAI